MWKLVLTFCLCACLCVAEQQQQQKTHAHARMQDLKVSHTSPVAEEYLQHLSGEHQKRGIRSYNAQEEHDKHVAALTALLFPHVQAGKSPLLPHTHASSKKMREADQGMSALQGYGEMMSRDLQLVPCVICRDMSNCPALNGFQIQEVYLPYNLNDLGTCRVLDALGKKVASEVFGNGRTFRDTPQCKDIVMQYLCLFYGSDNEMYINKCINQEDVTDSNPVNHKVTPRPPCRSFCVQVAEVCASDPKFMQLCYNIKCPPMEDSCTPDPTVEGQVLAANIGCDTPYDINPYFKKNSASAQHAISGRLLALLSGVYVSLMVLGVL